MGEERVLQETGIRRTALGYLAEALRDKVAGRVRVRACAAFELEGRAVRPGDRDGLRGRRRQLGRVALDDRLQLRKHVRKCLGRVGVCAHGDFHDRDTERPDVRGHRVRAAHTVRSDALRRHVALAPNVGLREALLELTRHAKVAQLHLTEGVDQYVRRLHIAVDDLQLVLQETQATHGTQRDLRQHILRHDAVPASRQLLETANVHVLHAVVHARLDKKGAIELHDLRR